MAVGATLAGAGAAAVAALGAASYAFAERGTHLLHQADMVGSSVEFMSSLSGGLELLGGNADSAGQSLFRFNSKLAEAIGGSAQAQQAFHRLGINANELNNMTTDDRMDRVSEAFQNLGSHAEKSRVAMQLFGRGGREMIEALSQPGGLVAMRAELQKLGLVVSAETAQSALELHKAFTLLKLSGTSLQNAVLEPMAPLFIAIASGVAAATRGVRDWAKENLQWLEAIGDAMKAGEFTLGWEIGLTTMKIAWIDFEDFLVARMGTLGQVIGGIFEAANFHIQAMREGINQIGIVLSGLANGAAWRQIMLELEASLLHFTVAQMPQSQGPDDGERNALGRQLREQMRRASALATRRDHEGPQPDEIMGRSSGARGTFNSGIAFGLAAQTNPVVVAVQQLHSDLIRQEAATVALGRYLADIAASVAEGVVFN